MLTVGMQLLNERSHAHYGKVGRIIGEVLVLVIREREEFQIWNFRASRKPTLSM